MDATTGGLDLARQLREAMLQALLAAWEDAGVRGLCAEGRFGAAVGALRVLDLRAVLDRVRGGAAGG